MYYDSTIYFLDPSFPEYKELEEKSQNLNALVSQLKIIERQDSLQKVAKMNEPQRNALIAGLIAKATIYSRFFHNIKRTTAARATASTTCHLPNKVIHKKNLVRIGFLKAYKRLSRLKSTSCV